MQSTGKRRVLLLSAYDTGSHRQWHRLLQDGIDWEWTLLTLPPRHFRWRIRGNPLSWWLLEPDTLARQYDLLIVTSMVDLATLRGLFPGLAATPALCYFHENQFAYPVSDGQHESIDPQMVNLYAAMSAEAVVFNSEWNRRSFLAGVRSLLDRLPDALSPGLVDYLSGKCEVLPVPLASDSPMRKDREPQLADRGGPHIVWNHRVEYDKGPDTLLSILKGLEHRGVSFELSLLGQRFRRQPDDWQKIEAGFAHRLRHNHFLPDRESYWQVLLSADVVLSTARHEFQGLSTQEAIAAGCRPVVPDALSYPEFVPACCRYSSVDEACERIAHWEDLPVPDLSAFTAERLLPAYQRLMERLVTAEPPA